jgi:hypothetical protein
MKHGIESWLSPYFVQLYEILETLNEAILMNEQTLMAVLSKSLPVPLYTLRYGEPNQLPVICVHTTFFVGLKVLSIREWQKISEKEQWELS